MSIQTNNTKAKSSKNSYSNTKVCNYYNKKGHLEKDCYKKINDSKKNLKSINSSNNLEEVNSINNNTIKEIILNSSKLSKAKNNNTINFILDLGATIHTCYIKELFNSITSTTTYIKQGNTNKTIKASGIGDISVTFTSTNKKVLIKDVLYIPKLGVNLLSLSLITSKDYNLVFKKDSCYIYKPNKSLLTKGSYKDKVSIFTAKSSKLLNYYNNNKKAITTLNTYNRVEEELESTISDSDLDLIDANKEDNIIVDKAIDLENNSKDLESNSNKEQIVLNKNTIELLYNRLGYINLKAIKKLKDNTKGVNIDLNDIDTTKTSLDNCIICIQSKLTKNRSTIPSTKVSAYLDLIYIDIGGPIRPKTFRGFKYYITFRDSYTKYLVVKLLKSRKAIVSIISNTIKELELEAKNNSSNSNTSNFNNNKVKAL